MSKILVRAMRAIGTLACLVGISARPAAATPDEPSNLSDCMAFEQDALDKGIEYRLVNHCERRVTCTVQWTLSCGDKPPLRQIRNSSSANVAAASERRITASADACVGEGWEISRVTWACSP